MLSVKDAAVRLNVSTSTIYSLIKCGQLRSHRVGVGRGVIRVSEANISDYLQSSASVIDRPPRHRRQSLKHIRL